MQPETAPASAINADAIFTELFLTAEGRANPYPLYDQLRQAEPVHRSKMGIWLLSRYDDCWRRCAIRAWARTTRRRSPSASAQTGAGIPRSPPASTRCSTPPVPSTRACASWSPARSRRARSIISSR